MSGIACHLKTYIIYRKSLSSCLVAYKVINGLRDRRRKKRRRSGGSDARRNVRQECVITIISFLIIKVRFSTALLKELEC